MAESTDVQDVSNGSEKGELSPTELKIIRQIEFYFGDKNLPRDKFLRQKTEEDHGWVTLECLSTFNRLKSMSVELLANAIKKSNSNIVEISEDLKKVRRLKPVEEQTAEVKQLSKAKTIYCKGFPNDTTLDELQEFFAEKGKVVFIMMRRLFASKEFKGSVFVEFSTVEEAKAFIEEEGTKYKDEVLIKKSKEDYYADKEKVRSQAKEEEKKAKLEAMGKQVKAEKPAPEEEELKYEKGSVIHFSGVGEQTSREDLKEMFGEHEEIAWVDFAREDPEGYIRFTKEGGAHRAVEAVKKAHGEKIMIRNKESNVRVLEGDEEKEFFRKVQEDKAKRRQRKGRDFGRGRGRGRGGRGSWGSKRRNDNRDEPRGEESEKKGKHQRFDDDEPPAKQIKAEQVNTEQDKPEVKTEQD